MVNGELKVDGNLGGETFGNVGDRTRRSVENTKLNDNRWHSYSLRIKDGNLEVLVNNKVIFSKKLSSKALTSLKKGIIVFESFTLSINSARS